MHVMQNACSTEHPFPKDWPTQLRLKQGLGR